MDYQQRFEDASAYYKDAMRRVAETQPPIGQKFAPGARVKISDNLGQHMSHFPSGKMATVRYTYAHAFGRTDTRSLQQYCLDIDEVGEVSWYDEDQLESMPNVQIEGQPASGLSRSNAGLG